jgi:hypothetical protein
MGVDRGGEGEGEIATKGIGRRLLDGRVISDVMECTKLTAPIRPNLSPSGGRKPSL